MAFSVKSYLDFENGSPEIRRFSIPEDVGTSYEYLVEKIRRMYPSLLRKDFRLYWRDEENELVLFSSDEELLMALSSNLQEGNLRVFIRVQNLDDASDGTSANKKEKHPGVVCDVCDKGIEGTRFKCLSCPDYDLCSGCEKKGFHPEHEMLRIRTPLRYPAKGFWHMFGPRGHHGGQRGHKRGKHGGRPCGSPCGPQPFGPPCGPPPFGPPCGPPPFGQGFPGCPFREDGKFDCPPSFFPYETTCSDKAPDANEEAAMKSEGCQEKANDCKNKQKMPTFEEIFGQVSEVARQFMNPEQFAAWGFNGANQCSEPKEVPVQKEEEKKDDAAKAEGEDAPMTSESFVVVDGDKKEGAGVPDDQGSNARKRPEEEEFERRLDEAIKQMESMGFNNDKGWLTHLIISKDFDINRVIDTLQLKQN